MRPRAARLQRQQPCPPPKRCSVGCGDALIRSVTQPPSESVTNESLSQLLSAASGGRSRRRKVLLGVLPQRAFS
jgi:hypothetical protein